ncbi:MAG: NAD(P)/FAD-dependent oxidoreductase, partial [Kiritimatiellae bacterium]|nr:NAD(P)/FAD-dependent oxidoreductase [Kiritimatiellia bacterium]
ALVPRTLEARAVRGLFVAGEAAEPVGRCGGFNLAWAWASARLAAAAVAGAKNHA